jgi:putative peptidoglycan lipid II flippase
MLAHPIVALVYQRGRFGGEAGFRTACVVGTYGIAVWAYSANHVVLRAYYALKDNITPVKIGASLVTLNFALNVTFVLVLERALRPHWSVRGETGLALATAITSTLGLFISLYVLKRRTGTLGTEGLGRSLGRCLVATVLMAAASAAALVVVPRLGLEGFAGRAATAGVPIAVGLVVFAAAAAALRAPELKELLSRRSRETTD